MDIQPQARSRGFHIITDEILQQLPELENINIGMINIFIKHTSASLTINENSDPTVCEDFESHFNAFLPENEPHYKHTLEGNGDMPAHIKASLLGASLNIPISPEFSSP